MDTIDADEIFRDNKGLDREEFERINRLLKEYRESGGARKEYDLMPPYGGPPLTPNPHGNRDDNGPFTDDRYRI
jgi:hypothetical protein